MYSVCHNYLLFYYFNILILQTYVSKLSEIGESLSVVYYTAPEKMHKSTHVEHEKDEKCEVQNFEKT
jgi:hypothetical protein